MFHPATAFLLVAVLPPIAAAGPPATQPDNAQVQRWLDRSAHELAALPADTPRDGLLPAPEELATEIYHLSPSDGRRALAERFVNAGLKSQLEKAGLADDERQAYLGASLNFAMLDDPVAARRMLAAADKPTGLAPTTDPSAQSAIAQDVWIRGAIYLVLNDTAEFNHLKLTPDDTQKIGWLMAYEGCDALAEFATARGAKLLKEATTQAGQALPGPGLDEVSESVKRGDFAGAARIARELADRIPANGNGNEACAAYFMLAQGCADAGDLPGYYQARDAMLSIDHKTNPKIDFQLPLLLHLCTRVNDQAGFAQVADLWKSQIQHEATGPISSRLAYARNMAGLATEYAAMNDTTDYQSSIGEAEKILRAIQVRPGSRHASSIANDRALAYLHIAAARARAGDVGGVASDQSASLKSAKLDPLDFEYATESIAGRFADAGLFDDALTVLADTGPDKFGITLQYITHRMVRAGKVDKAWQTLASVPAARTAKGVCDLILQETRAGRAAGWAKRIDALPSPLERATADFEVAATLAGRPFQGVLEIFKVSED